MNKLFGALIGIVICTSVTADMNDFRCFKSIGVKPPLKLQFVFQTDKSDMGYVIYQNGNSPIVVKNVKEREVKKIPGGGPSVIESQWEEVTTDGIGGKYIIVSQGALVSEFQYVRKQDGKIFKFAEDTAVSTDDGCEWK